MGFMSKKQQSVPRRRLERNDDFRVRPTATDLEARYAFRRNRTLTGSLSSDVASVGEHHAELKSARVHTHHLRRHRRRAFGGLLVVIAACLALMFLLSQAIISATVISSVQPTNTVIYEQKIQEYLHTHPLERFRLSLNTQSLASYL